MLLADTEQADFTNSYSVSLSPDTMPQHCSLLKEQNSSSSQNAEMPETATCQPGKQGGESCVHGEDSCTYKPCSPIAPPPLEKTESP